MLTNQLPRLPMLRVMKASNKRSKKLLIFSAHQNASKKSVHEFQKESCSLGLRELVRHCLLARLLAKQELVSYPSLVLTSWRCSLVSAQAVCETSSSKQPKWVEQLFLSTKLTQSVVSAARVWAADMTNVNKHSIKCLPKWTASKPPKASLY